MYDFMTQMRSLLTTVGNILRAFDVFFGYFGKYYEMISKYVFI